MRRRGQFRQQVIRDAWTLAKRFAATDIQNIEFREVPFLYDGVVEGYIDDPQRSIIAAFIREFGCETFFEIGTSLGRTTWTVAHHNPTLEIYTLDVPQTTEADETAFAVGADDRTYFRPAQACGEAFRETSESDRITQLWGDSATFDYTPYTDKIDFVYIDGAHTYEYVKNDTQWVLQMLSPDGTIVWDDYVTSPGVYEYLNELAPSLDRPLYHLLGTRMAIYSRQDFVRQRQPDNFPFG